MATRLVHVVADANDPASLARFWASALEWDIADETGEEVDVWPAGYQYPDPVAMPLVFVPVPEPKAGKNRVHLDLATTSARHQADLVGRLKDLGATPADIGQGDVPWELMADPEGNEFCVLEPRQTYLDTGPVAAILTDCGDPAALARFWVKASGWQVQYAQDNIVGLRSPEGVGPYLEFLRVPDPKTVKNRVHPDVAPFRGDDPASEVARLLNDGATPADVGQGDDVSWTVLADPEGNEFCVLSPR
ncbi:MAG TPA: VOC family protein [Streptosporangiaceae bacterium]|jgi:predicted enzyme related to lactoylglutathione lyase|nr:VOC family protein [Streptosporangiaceae bacterium]